MAITPLTCYKAMRLEFVRFVYFMVWHPGYCLIHYAFIDIKEKLLASAVRSYFFFDSIAIVLGRFDRRIMIIITIIEVEYVK